MCTININNEFDNILFTSNLLDKDSKQLGKDRQKLFYFRCIPIRFFLFLVLFYMSQIKNDTFQMFLKIGLIFIYLTTTIHLISKKSKCQWWSNNYEVLLSILAILICIFVKEHATFYVSLLLLSSIIGGIIQSIYLHPFSNM